MGRLGGTASDEIDAPLAQVWALIEDVASIPEWQGAVDSMRTLERDGEGRPALCESSSDAKVTTIKSTLRFTYEPPTRLSWTQVSGDLRSLHGAWTLQDLGGGRTRATITMDADTGFRLGLLVRGPAERLLRGLLVDARPSELKARLQAHG
jgi:uncharacterized protein YndB with AHSA1/START domain